MDAEPSLPGRRLHAVKIGSGLSRLWRRIFGGLALAIPIAWAALSGYPVTVPVRPTGGYFLPVPLAPWYAALNKLFLVAWILCALAYVAARWLPLWSKRGEVVSGEESITLELEDGSRRTIPRDQIAFVARHSDRGVNVHLTNGEVVRVRGDSDGDYGRVFRGILASSPARVHIGAAAVERTGCAVPVAWCVAGAGYLTVLGLTTEIVERLRQGLWLASSSALGWAVIFAGVVALALSLLRRRQLMIGRDGVRVGGLLRPKFVPFSAVESIGVRSGQGLRFLFLHLANGKRVTIPVLGDPEAPAQRVREAFDAWQTSASVPQVDALQRGERATEEWAEAIRGRTDDASYRHAGLRIEDLENIVDNPRATPEQRIGAALALSSDGDGQRRARIAAAGCADPDLQAALEAAACGELAERPLARVTRRS